MTRRIASASVETQKRSQGREFLNDVLSRWRAGEAPNAAAIVNAHPELASVKSLIIDLAYEEFCLRSEAGETIDISAFCSRFPEYHQSLQRRLEVHDFFTDSFPSLGETVFGMKLIDELGRGALGRVYLAEEIDVGSRLVAVKFSYHGKYEAEFLGRLSHPNIVPVYSFRHDELSGLSAVVMPFLGQYTLADSRPKDIDSALTVAIELADALTYTHSQGILHRDLKPSNVLMAERPMVMDFNLSTDISKDANRLGGTPHYMAPEQAAQLSGQSHAVVDERADVYSLGVILQEIIAPFRVGPVLDNIVRRATAREPEQRFATADELAIALRRQLSPYRRGVRWAARHPALVAVFVVGLAICGYLIATRPSFVVRERARALQEIAAGNPASAINRMLRILDAEPDSADAMFLLGRARLQAGKVDAAYENFDDVYRKTKSGESAACAAYANCLRSSDPFTTKRWHDAAIAAGFRSPQMDNNIGYTYRMAGDYATAIEHLNSALREMPSLSTAVYNSALTELQIAVQSNTPVSQATLDKFDDALRKCGPSGSLCRAAANAWARSATPDQGKVIELIDDALDHGTNLLGLKSEFPMLHGNPRFEELFTKRRTPKSVTPVYLSDPLGKLPDTFKGKYD